MLSRDQMNQDDVHVERFVYNILHKYVLVSVMTYKYGSFE
jgi:hypothetical protein